MNLVFLWWKYSTPHPHHKIFLWSCGKLYYKFIYEKCFFPRFETLVVNLLVLWWKWKYANTHPPPPDFLLVSWWILLQNYIWKIFFFLDLNILWLILFSWVKYSKLHPHHKIFLWSQGELYYKIIYDKYFSSYFWKYCGESCGSLVKMKIFQTPPPPQDFLVVLWWILLIKSYKIYIFLLKLKLFWWILLWWKYSKPHPYQKIFLWSCGEFYYKIIYEKYFSS